MDIEIQDPDTKLENTNEFISIIIYLVHNDLAVLHEVLMLENEEDQHKRLREMRSYITSYPTIYNAWTARVLVDNPNYYITNEIISRYKKLFFV